MGQRQDLYLQRLGTVALAVIIPTEEKWSGTLLRVFSVAVCSLWPLVLASVFFTSLLLVPSSRGHENTSALKSLLYHPWVYTSQGLSHVCLVLPIQCMRFLATKYMRALMVRCIFPWVRLSRYFILKHLSFLTSAVLCPFLLCFLSERPGVSLMSPRNASRESPLTQAY